MNPSATATVEILSRPHALYPFTPLKGGTTHSLFTICGKRYVVRMRHKGRWLGALPFEEEVRQHKNAASLGVAPPIIWTNSYGKLLVMPFIPPTKPLNLRNSTALKQALETIRSYQRSKLPFSQKNCPIASTITYYREFERKENYWEPLIQKALAIHDEYRDPRHFCPCHNDLHSGNFLPSKNKLYLIDWEYSSMGHPLFDLATLASGEFFSEEECATLLQYWQPHPQKQQLRTLLRMKFVADLRWALWSFLYSSEPSIQEPLEEWGFRYLSLCQQALNNWWMR